MIQWRDGYGLSLGMGTFFDFASKWIMIALAALLPLFIIPGGAATIPQAKMFFLTALVAAAAAFWAISVFYGRATVPRNIIVFGAAFLPIAYALSALIAGWPNSAVVSGQGGEDTVVAICIWFASLVIAASVFQGERSQAHVLRAVLLSGFVLTLFQFARLFFPDVLSFNVLTSQTATAVGSWHDLGIILGLYAILGLVMYHSSVAYGALWRYLTLTTTALTFLLLIVINMSDVWYIFAGTLLLTALYLWFTASISRLQLIVISIMIVLAFLFSYFGVFVHDYLPSHMRVVAIEVRPSWSGTFTIGREVAQESRTLFFGSGPNSFVRSWALFKPTSVNATQFWGFDFSAGVGVVPTAFVTLGIVGFLAWLLTSAAFSWALWKEFRGRWQVSSSAPRKQFGIVVAAIYLLIFHIIYAPGVVISALLFLFLGLFAATSVKGPVPVEQETSVTTERGHDIYEKVSAGIFAGLALAASLMSGQALASDIMLNKSILSYARDGNIAESSAKLGKALSIWPSNDRAHRAAVELGILELQALAASADNPGQENLQATLKQAIEHGLAAVEIDRTDYQNWLTLAILYQQLAGAGVSGAYEQAKQAFAEAKAENPTNPLLSFRLAQLEALEGNRDAALKSLEDTVTMKPDFAAAYFLASQLFAEGGHGQEAIRSAATAAQLVPDDPLAWYNLGTMLYAAGQYRESVSAFAQAVTLNNNYSNALFMQALAHSKLGERQEALALLARVAELNQNDPSVPAIINNLNAGKEPFFGLAGQ